MKEYLGQRAIVSNEDKSWIAFLSALVKIFQNVNPRKRRSGEKMKSMSLISVLMLSVSIHAVAAETGQPPSASSSGPNAQCEGLQQKITTALDGKQLDQAAEMVTQFETGCGKINQTYLDLAKQYNQRLTEARAQAAPKPRSEGGGIMGMFRKTVGLGGQEPKGTGSDGAPAAKPENNSPSVFGMLSALRPGAASLPSTTPSVTKHMAVLDAVTASSPQEMITALAPVLSDSIRRNPGIIKKLAALDVMTANSTQEALAILQPILTEAATQNPKYAAQMAALSLLISSSPNQAFAVLKPVLATAAGSNPTVARKLAALDILAGNSPQEIITILKTAMADATVNNPALAKKLSGVGSLQNITARDALALLKPVMLDAISRKPDVAKKLAILEALAAGAPEEALAIMRPALAEAIARNPTAKR